MARHYLDHASTSPLRPEARAALLEGLDAVGGDPGRIHHEGMTARALLEDARDRLAAAFGARSREVVLTSGATESVATAVAGCAAAAPGRAIVCPAVEHSAVRLAAERAAPGSAGSGFDEGDQFDGSGAGQGPTGAGGGVLGVPVDRTGRIDLDGLVAVVDRLIAAGTPPALVCCQWANHEVGTLQPVAEVVAACRERRVPVLVDAAQAAGREAIAFDDLGADLLAISGHKLGGPAGTGALLIRRGLRIEPLLVGGDQERARRAGLENTPGALALAAAAEAATASLDTARADDERRSGVLRRALAGIDGVELFGHPEHRLASLVCAGIGGVEPQAVLLGLDRAGVAAHSGSACASEGLEPSPVLEAMGVDAHRSLRLSVGWSTTDADVEAAARALPAIVADLRALGA